VSEEKKVICASTGFRSVADTLKHRKAHLTKYMAEKILDYNKDSPS